MALDSRISRAICLLVAFGWLTLTVAAHPALQTPAPEQRAASGAADEAPLLAAEAVPAEPATGERGARQVLPPFERVLPAETLAWLGIDDVSALKANFAASPSGRMLEDEAFAPLRATLSAQLQALRLTAEQALGADPVSLLEYLAGPVTLAVTLPESDAEAGDDVAFTVCLLADVGAHRGEVEALLDKLVARVQQHDSQLKLGKQTVAGVQLATLTQWGYASKDMKATAIATDPGGTKLASATTADAWPEGVLSWGFRGPLLVATFAWHAPGDELLARVLTGLDGLSSGAVLADLPEFRQSQAAPAGGCRAWVDLGAIVRRVHEHMSRYESGEEEEQLMGELGLLDLGALSQRYACGASGSEWSVGLEWRGSGWIPRLARLLIQPGGTRMLELVPANCRSATVSHFDAAALFDSTAKMLLELGALTPAELVETLSGVEEKLGFSPRDELLELFDGEVAIVSFGADLEGAFPGTAMDPVNFAVIMGLRDGPAFANLVDGLVRSTGFNAARVREDFEGVTLDHFTLLPPFALHYAILDDVFVASPSSALLRDVVRLKLHPELPNLAENPTLTAAFARLPANCGLLGYNDTAASVEGAMKAIRKLPDMLAGAASQMPPELQGLLGWLRTLPLPDPAVVRRYLSGPTVTCVTMDEDGLLLRSLGP